MKMELHKTNYNSSDSQNFTEKSKQDSKHIVNFLEFFRHKIEEINSTNLNHIYQNELAQKVI